MRLQIGIGCHAFFNTKFWSGNLKRRESSELLDGRYQLVLKT
jgi:hypothetical protein